MAHNLILNYGLYKKMHIYVSCFKEHTLVFQPPQGAISGI
jgi:hypothetical protein